MKKTYIQPQTEVTELIAEQGFLIGSLVVDDSKNISSESDMWSNIESDVNVW